MDAARTPERLAARLVPLRESQRFQAPTLERFAEWIAAAPEEELFRINPIQFADRHGLSSRDAIDLFVHAARTGIFDFSWGVVCRDCGAFITTKGGLRSLGRTRLCKL
jgi:hypothetical protein